MHRISTNLTLFYKFFLPVFWIVFFGALTVAALFYPFDYIGDMPAGNFRIGIVFFYLTGLLLLAAPLLSPRPMKGPFAAMFIALGWAGVGRLLVALEGPEATYLDRLTAFLEDGRARRAHG